MAVPEEIRNVERPRNTIVIDNGTGCKRYAVIQRVGCRRENGRNLPVNGKTVGHIIDNVFVPGVRKLSRKVVEIKDFATPFLVDSLSRGLFKDLCVLYDPKESARIYAMALLKVCSKDIPYYEMEQKYRQGWASELFPDLPMSRDSISDFLKTLGQNYSRIAGFMRSRCAAIAGNQHIAIDGMLKSDTSGTNTLSQFSRKARIKGARDISVLFAYSIESKEPVCSKVFAGNIIDQVAYNGFLRENGLSIGVVMGDKGFPRSQAEEAFASSPNLHWLDPLKRNDRRMERYELYSYTGMLDDKQRDVLFKKVELEGTFLYSFYDRRRGAKEEADYFRHHKDKAYDPEDRESHEKRFGTVAFESDLDAEPLVIYKMYDERWLIEEFFRYYKDFLGFDDTRVQSDYSVLGSEFVNFFASVMTSRLFNRFDDIGLFSRLSFSQIMEELDTAKKVRIGQEGAWEFVQTTEKTNALLVALDLVPKPEAASERAEAKKEPAKDVGQKRPRGRPRKNPLVIK